MAEEPEDSPVSQGTPRQPLSDNLVVMLKTAGPQETLTLNRVLEWTEGRGIFLLIVLLCFPFLTPVSIPGTSTPLGLVILWLGIRIAFGLPQSLPPVLGERQLPHGFNRVLNGSVRVLRFLERWIQPRRAPWLTWRSVRMTNGLLMALMAALLALPIPPVILFTNMFPAYSILILALSMMEQDALFLSIGYLASLGTLAYFIVWGDFIAHFAERYYEPMRQWLQGIF